MENRFGNGRLRALFLVILVLAVFLEGRMICNAPTIPTEDGGRDAQVSGDLAVGQEEQKEIRKEKRESSGRKKWMPGFSALKAERKPVGDTAGKRNSLIRILRC